MNFDQNLILLVGRVVRPLELKKTTKEGKSWGYLHVATTYGWKDKDSGEKKEKTTWHSLKVWGKKAEDAAKYLKKGQQVRIEGHMVSDETEVDGKKVYYYYPQIDIIKYGYEARGEKKEGTVNVAASESKSTDNVDVATLMKQMAALNAMVSKLTQPATPTEPPRESVVGTFPDEGTPQMAAGM